jgi:hypothetical protein
MDAIATAFPYVRSGKTNLAALHSVRCIADIFGFHKNFCIIVQHNRLAGLGLAPVGTGSVVNCEGTTDEKLRRWLSQFWEGVNL